MKMLMRIVQLSENPLYIQSKLVFFRSQYIDDHKKNKLKPSYRGFTLAELVIIIVIIEFLQFLHLQEQILV